MEYICGLHKKYGFAVTVTALYMIAQLFLLISLNAPKSGALQSSGSIYVTEAVDSISNSTLGARSSETRHEDFPQKSFDFPNGFAEDCFESQAARADAAAAFSFLNVRAGGLRESLAYTDMVSRK